VLAANTARRTASAERTSGRAAPAGTAIDTPDLTRSVRLSGSKLPAAMRLSIAVLESTTTSTASPARTRLATSTPPAASLITDWPVERSYCATSSFSNSRVAMEESSLSGLKAIRESRGGLGTLRASLACAAPVKLRSDTARARGRSSHIVGTSVALGPFQRSHLSQSNHEHHQATRSSQGHGTRAGGKRSRTCRNHRR